jgi:signal transduction histidine kinase
MAAVIIGMSELAAANVAADPKLAAMVKQIDEAAGRGAQLVQRMLLERTPEQDRSRWNPLPRIQREAEA